MFRVTDEHEFEWPVEIRKPVGVDAEGKPDFEVHRIFVTFLALPLDKAGAEMAADEKDGDPGSESGTDAPARRPLMQRVILGWRGVGDEDGSELPCNPDNIARLCRIGYVGAALTETYFQALLGRAAKN